MKSTKITIVGGGPAGMMAAIAAGQNSNEIFLLERNSSLGKKLLLTGKGRCNFTTAKTIPEIIEAFEPKGKFLYSALTKFSNTDLISFFEQRDIKTHEERGQRIFPVSNDAHKILDCLVLELNKCKVNLSLNFRVAKIKKKENKFLILNNKNKIITADKLILATGGKTYPQTGSTGDGYKLAKSLGHKIIKPQPSLVGLTTNDKDIKKLAGLSLKNVRLYIGVGNKTIINLFGEMLFTHLGISGPIVLEASRFVAGLLQKKKSLTATIDLKPALNKKILKKRIYREIHSLAKKEFQSLLKELLPRLLISFVCNKLAIDKKVKNASLSSKQVDKLIDFLKAVEFPLTGTAPFSTAIVTKGGVDINQINSSTMESKLVSGLYFCGEIIALDGPTGGYNLQKAFSTGYVAGKSV